MPEAAVREVRRAVRAALGSESAQVLVALSGGADSLALLGAALAEAPTLRLSVGAVVVDHGLQEASADVAARAAGTASGLGATPVEVVRVFVEGDGGPEAAARDARYCALDDAATRLGASAVLLGHTREDQAESVLLGLARGSGARSLSGMSAVLDRDGVRYLRPLLGVSRVTTRAVCAELGLEPWDDPQNEDPAYLRVRVRHELLPVVADVLGPAAVTALARSADLLRDDADALDVWARRALDDAVGPEGLDVEHLATLPPAIRRRVLRMAGLDAGVPAGSFTAAHVDALDALVDRWHGQGPVALPGPVAATRSCGRLTFRGR